MYTPYNKYLLYKYLQPRAMQRTPDKILGFKLLRKENRKLFGT